MPLASSTEETANISAGFTADTSSETSISSDPLTQIAATIFKQIRHMLYLRDRYKLIYDSCPVEVEVCYIQGNVEICPSFYDAAREIIPFAGEVPDLIRLADWIKKIPGFTAWFTVVATKYDLKVSSLSDERLPSNLDEVFFF